MKQGYHVTYYKDGIPYFHHRMGVRDSISVEKSDKLIKESKKPKAKGK